MNNTSAFPTGLITDDKGLIIGGSNGMGLRDYFAAKVMYSFALLSANDYEHDETFTREDYIDYCNSVAGSAYDMADAMMKARGV